MTFIGPHPAGTPPPRGRQPIFNAPPGTAVLCLLLIAVFAFGWLFGPRVETWMIAFFAYWPEAFVAHFWAGGGGFDAVTLLVLLSLISHALLHGSALHLMLNTGFLLAFGSFTERALGLGPFLLTFALSAAVGALAQTVAGGAQQPPMIGASGAVYGLMGAAVRLLFVGLGTAPMRRGLQFVAVILGLNVILGVLSGGGSLLDGRIAWQAHLGGFAMGFLLGLLFVRRRRGSM